MFRMMQLFLISVFTIVLSQDAPGVSGTVIDSRTKEPVSNANVKLIGLNISCTTDDNGKFDFAGTPVRRSVSAKSLPAIELQGNNNLLFRNSIEGIVNIRVYDLQGKLCSVIFSGKLSGGTWHFPMPQYSRGIHLCRVISPEGRFSFELLSTSGNALHSINSIRSSSDLNFSALGKKAAESKDNPGIADSLVVSKAGYFNTVTLLDSLHKTGMNILLTDTSDSKEATIVPDSSWTCSMPDGIPPPALGELVFSATLQVNASHNLGFVPYGHRSFQVIKNGTITGSKLSANVLAGGLEYVLQLTNGTVELEEIHILKASDGTQILMHNYGVAPAGDPVIRVVADFEVPNSSSSNAWLNTGKFAALRSYNASAGTIKLDVYDISKISMPEKKIVFKDPESLPDQPCECQKLSGSKGESIFTENVSLGSSVSIGASKRGSRNIIPITGGTVSGRFSGSIFNAGADYQLTPSGKSTILDARYILAPSDGDFIIVRNCGPMGALIPQFEARTAGPYVYLNSNKYISSDPGMGSGGVSITFYGVK